MRGVRGVEIVLLLPATALLSAVTMLLSGCGGVPGAETGTTGEALRVTFDSGGGNFAIAEDTSGNEYSFRAREEVDGTTIITEANVKVADGTTLKASLDAEGRPVNFRMSDNTAADLVYDGNAVSVRLTAPDGSLIEADQAVNYALARDRVVKRRAAYRAARSKDAVRMQQIDSAKAETLRNGLATYEEIVESIFDDAQNPNSPLATNPQAADLRDAALRVGQVASIFGFDEVAPTDIEDDVTLDDIPEVIRQIAGHTYVLFDAEGFCIEMTDVASRLTFDNNGVLQTEFDRHLVFPDFSIGGGGEPGITINYSTGTPINLTPGDGADFGLAVTPVFTGTQLDDQGGLTIERRFSAELTFDISLFGVAAAEAQQLFDAAFLNGTLSPDATVLEFDLVLVDLQEDNPSVQLGRLRYHDQNSIAPEPIFTCEVITGENSDAGIFCPGSVAQGEEFPVEFVFGHDDHDRLLEFDWFVSDGFGSVVGDPFGPMTYVRPTGTGFMEVTLVVSDTTTGDDVFEVYACSIDVGRASADVLPPPPDLFLECPPGLNVGEPGFFSVSGPGLAGLEFGNWFVFGTSDFFISDPFATDVEIELFQPGKFEVAYQAFDATDHEVFLGCEVFVGGVGFDECAVNGWYGDGVCDGFCLEPDPDCEAFTDFCELNGWYGDGACDDFCPLPDPDCAGDFIDECALNGWYGDGACDLFCPLPDPDCDFYDFCFEDGLYGDGICDDFCPQPDPDCEVFIDVCEQNGWYGDGACHEFCPFPDPDCDLVDICFENGWYGDGACDLFCPFPDPDCDNTDVCETEGLYGDGMCDAFCPLPDPDCEFFDVCLENGWYGDGACDEFCPEPDPDCADIDICEQNGWYGDGICQDCPFPDPDCDVVDICEVNGWYGDGACDDFCPLHDPDCDVVDLCLQNGLYGDGVCDDCPLPDPDCDTVDICEVNGWYGDGACDDFCPLPDPDCDVIDFCLDLGLYGDGVCDADCPQPDPDCL